MDVLKGIGILFVIFSHFGWSTEQRLKMFFPFLVDMAVPIFMVISGYVYFFSFEKNKIGTYEDSWKLKFLIPKIIRYSIPFFITIIIEFLCALLFHKLDYLFFIDVFRGGTGPGSYYFPIMIQFLFVFSFIYFFVKKYGFKGFMLIVLLNGLYEFFQRIFLLNEECYRLLLFRYISVIAFGSLLASEHKKQIKPLFYIFAFIIGVGFILLISYTSYTPKIIIYWSGTCFLATLYILPLSALLIEKCKNVRLRILESMGKASFNIFLAQMVYFPYFNGIGNKLLDKVENWYLFVTLQNTINIVVCVCTGLVFYEIEGRLTKKILIFSAKIFK